MAEAKQLDGFENIKVEVERTGRKIILPAEPRPMTYDRGIETLKQYKIEDETTIAVNEIVDAWPLDGAYAFMKAMKQMYGWATPVPTPTWFGPKPPDMVSLEVGVGQRVQVIWGLFTLPALEKTQLSCGAVPQADRMVFCIQGECKKKDLPEIRDLANLTRQIVSAESVYRGKAFNLPIRSNGEIDWGRQPSFMDTRRTRPEELIFSDELAEQVRTHLFTPIRHTAKCKQMGIPMKRGVLLEGPFGTGKTMTAQVLAKTSEENGWTFIVISSVTGLKAALIFARMYQPAVVFCEDIDRSMEGERSMNMDEILNTIDGVTSKNAEIITVLTTNAVQKINQAMLRPGRLDAVLHIAPPDKDAAIRLMRLYGRNLIAETDPLDEAGKEMTGQIPAVIREVVERSKLYAIGRLGDEADTVKLTDHDLAHSARGMKKHLELLSGKRDETPTPEQALGNAMVQLIAKAGGLEDNSHVVSLVENTDDNVERIKQRVGA